MQEAAVHLHRDPLPGVLRTQVEHGRAGAVDPAIDTAARRLAADLTLVDERIVVIEGVVPRTRE